jgi:two-component system C4-dicarboxylate transport response regulator DctD
MRPLSARHVRDLVEQPWPGNVRELRNAAERYAFGLDRLGAAPDPGEAGLQPLAARVEAYERSLIEQALQQAQGNIADAMRLLDVPRRTLNEKMQRYGLSRGDFVG